MRSQRLCVFPPTFCTHLHLANFIVKWPLLSPPLNSILVNFYWFLWIPQPRDRLVLSSVTSPLISIFEKLIPRPVKPQKLSFSVDDKSTPWPCSAFPAAVFHNIHSFAPTITWAHCFSIGHYTAARDGPQTQVVF